MLSAARASSLATGALGCPGGQCSRAAGQAARAGSLGGRLAQVSYGGGQHMVVATRAGWRCDGEKAAWQWDDDDPEWRR